MQLYTRKELVGFGNLLLENYNVMVHSTDGTNSPLYQRQVSDVDLESWDRICYPFPNRLPSNLQIGDDVGVILGNGRVWGTVLNVKFSESKVFYDIEVYFPEKTDSGVRNVTRVYNIDSAFVYPRSIRPDLVPATPIAPETA